MNFRPKSDLPKIVSEKLIIKTNNDERLIHYYVKSNATGIMKKLRSKREEENIITKK